MNEITKRRLVYWLLSVLNYLAAAAQHNFCLAVYYDQLFQLEQQLLLSLVNHSTARIQRAYKLLKNSSKKRRPRRFWERPGRVGCWWDNFINDVVIPEEWVENFRMSKDSFMSLCYELKPYIEKEVTRLRLPIPFTKRVAITLYYLVDEGRYRKTANAFGVSRAAVSIIVRDVCRAISLHLGPKYIKMPTTDEDVLNAVEAFEKSMVSLNVLEQWMVPMFLLEDHQKTQLTILIGRIGILSTFRPPVTTIIASQM